LTFARLPAHLILSQILKTSNVVHCLLPGWLTAWDGGYTGTSLAGWFLNFQLWGLKRTFKEEEEIEIGKTKSIHLGVAERERERES
jgi:hypothetical protein